MLKHKYHAAKLLPAKSSQPQAAGLPLALHGRAPVAQVLRQVDVKKAALAVGGAALGVSVLHWAHQYRFYHSVVAKELKKQLAPIEQKLDALQEENAQLRAELAKAQSKRAE